MGRGWVNAVREAAGAKKGKLFTKLAKEIAVAVRIGGVNPDSNARLRTALKEAQKNSVPRDTVERAIKRGSGGGDEANLEEVTYEGYGPHGVAVLIDALTDNRNRTVQDLRAQFARGGGNFGEAGSVMWMFDRVGTVIAKPPKPDVDAEEAAINAGANEVEDFGEGEWCFYTGTSEVESVATELGKLGWHVDKHELSFKPKTPATLSPDQEEDLKKFLELVNDNDDVKKVHLSV